MMELLDQYQTLEIALKLSRGRRKKHNKVGMLGGGLHMATMLKKGRSRLKSTGMKL